MYKKCCNCNQNLSIDLFNKCSSRKDGLQTICRSCKKIKYNTNRTDNLKRAKKYREENSQAISEYLVQYRANNKESIRKNFKQYYETNKINFLMSNSKRRASKLMATPSWLTEDQLIEIKELYEIAKMFKIYTGDEYHVDHIVPLQGETVCGLHVPWNLQVITANENLAKSNRLVEDII